jgi:hypothetical protein
MIRKSGYRFSDACGTFAKAAAGTEPPFTSGSPPVYRDENMGLPLAVASAGTSSCMTSLGDLAVDDPEDVEVLVAPHRSDDQPR